MRKHHITAKQYHSPLANKTARLPYEKSRKGSFFNDVSLLRYDVAYANDVLLRKMMYSICECFGGKLTLAIIVFVFNSTRR